jgi:hypothetical protein
MTLMGFLAVITLVQVFSTILVAGSASSEFSEGEKAMSGKKLSQVSWSFMLPEYEFSKSRFNLVLNRGEKTFVHVCLDETFYYSYHIDFTST